jgi:hypothetical protein
MRLTIHTTREGRIRWAPELDQRLIAGREAGKTERQIAGEFRCGVTKNSVHGRLYRLSRKP